MLPAPAPHTHTMEDNALALDVEVSNVWENEMTLRVRCRVDLPLKRWRVVVRAEQFKFERYNDAPEEPVTVYDLPTGAEVTLGVCGMVSLAGQEDQWSAWVERSIQLLRPVTIVQNKVHSTSLDLAWGHCTEAGVLASDATLAHRQSQALLDASGCNVSVRYSPVMHYEVTITERLRTSSAPVFSRVVEAKSLPQRFRLDGLTPYRIFDVKVKPKRHAGKNVMAGWGRPSAPLCCATLYPVVHRPLERGQNFLKLEVMRDAPAQYAQNPHAFVDADSNFRERDSAIRAYKMRVVEVEHTPPPKAVYGPPADDDVSADPVVLRYAVRSSARPVAKRPDADGDEDVDHDGHGYLLDTANAPAVFEAAYENINAHEGVAVNIPALRADTCYILHATVTDSDGVPSWERRFLFRTAPPLTILRFRKLTAADMEVSWIVDDARRLRQTRLPQYDAKFVDVPVCPHEFQVRVVHPRRPDVVVTRTADEQNWVRIEGLEEDTEYLVQLRQRSVSGYVSDWSRSIAVRTLPRLRPRVAGRGANYIDVEWERPAPPLVTWADRAGEADRLDEYEGQPGETRKIVSREPATHAFRERAIVDPVIAVDDPREVILGIVDREEEELCAPHTTGALGEGNPSWGRVAGVQTLTPGIIRKFDAPFGRTRFEHLEPDTEYRISLNEQRADGVWSGRLSRVVRTLPRDVCILSPHEALKSPRFPHIDEVFHTDVTERTALELEASPRRLANTSVGVSAAAEPAGALEVCKSGAGSPGPKPAGTEETSRPAPAIVLHTEVQEVGENHALVSWAFRDFVVERARASTDLASLPTAKHYNAAVKDRFREYRLMITRVPDPYDPTQPHDTDLTIATDETAGGLTRNFYLRCKGRSTRLTDLLANMRYVVRMSFFCEGTCQWSAWSTPKGFTTARHLELYAQAVHRDCFVLRWSRHTPPQGVNPDSYAANAATTVVKRYLLRVEDIIDGTERQLVMDGVSHPLRSYHNLTGVEGNKVYRITVAPQHANNCWGTSSAPLDVIYQVLTFRVRSVGDRTALLEWALPAYRLGKCGKIIVSIRKVGYRGRNGTLFLPKPRPDRKMKHVLEVHRGPDGGEVLSSSPGRDGVEVVDLTASDVSGTPRRGPKRHASGGSAAAKQHGVSDSINVSTALELSAASSAGGIAVAPLDAFASTTEGGGTGGGTAGTYARVGSVADIARLDRTMSSLGLNMQSSPGTPQNLSRGNSLLADGSPQSRKNSQLARRASAATTGSPRARARVGSLRRVSEVAAGPDPDDQLPSARSIRSTASARDAERQQGENEEDEEASADPVEFEWREEIELDPTATSYRFPMLEPRKRYEVVVIYTGEVPKVTEKVLRGVMACRRAGAKMWHEFYHRVFETSGLLDLTLVCVGQGFALITWRRMTPDVGADGGGGSPTKGAATPSPTTHEVHLTDCTTCRTTVETVSPVDSLFGKHISWRLANLLPCRRYSAKVRRKLPCGAWSSFSNPVYFTTQAKLVVSVVGTGESFLRLQWRSGDAPPPTVVQEGQHVPDSVPRQTEPYRKYEVSVTMFSAAPSRNATIPFPTSLDAKIVTYPPGGAQGLGADRRSTRTIECTDPHVLVGHLKSNSSFSVKVRGMVQDHGWEEFSDVVTGQTLPVTTARVMSRGSNYLRVTWQRTSTANNLLLRDAACLTVESETEVYCDGARHARTVTTHDSIDSGVIVLQPLPPASSFVLRTRLRYAGEVEDWLPWMVADTTQRLTSQLVRLRETEMTLRYTRPTSAHVAVQMQPATPKVSEAGDDAAALCADTDVEVAREVAASTLVASARAMVAAAPAGGSQRQRDAFMAYSGGDLLEQLEAVVVAGLARWQIKVRCPDGGNVNENKATLELDIPHQAKGDAASAAGVAEHAGEMEVTVPDLSPDVLYAVMCRCVDVNGVASPWSEEMFVSTLPLVELTVTHIAENFVYARWERPRFSYHSNPLLRGYDVRGDLGCDLKWELLVFDERRSIQQHVVPGDVHSLKIEHLQSSTQYSVAVRAALVAPVLNREPPTDIVNVPWGMWSGKVYTTTAHQVTHAIERVGLDYIVVRWDVQGASDFGKKGLVARGKQTRTRHHMAGRAREWTFASVDHYQLHVRCKADDLEKVLTIAHVDGETTFRGVVTGLQEGAGYEVRVRACYVTEDDDEPLDAPTRASSLTAAGGAVRELDDNGDEVAGGGGDNEPAAPPANKRKNYDYGGFDRVLAASTAQKIKVTTVHIGGTTATFNCQPGKWGTHGATCTKRTYDVRYNGIYLSTPLELDLQTQAVASIKLHDLRMDAQYILQVRERAAAPADPLHRHHGNWVELHKFFTKPQAPCTGDLMEWRHNRISFTFGVTTDEGKVLLDRDVPKEYVFCVEIMNKSDTKKKDRESDADVDAQWHQLGIVKRGRIQTVLDQPIHDCCFRVKAANHVVLERNVSVPLWGEYSNIMHWSEPSPPNSVTAVRVGNLKAHSATLKWDKPTNHMTQPELYYVILVANTVDTGERIWVTFGKAHTNHYTLQNLNSNTVYRMCVRAESNFGRSGKSSVLTFTTNVDTGAREVAPKGGDAAQEAAVSTYSSTRSAGKVRAASASASASQRLGGRSQSQSPRDAEGSTRRRKRGVGDASAGPRPKSALAPVRHHKGAGAGAVPGDTTTATLRGIDDEWRKKPWRSVPPSTPPRDFATTPEPQGATGDPAPATRSAKKMPSASRTPSLTPASRIVISPPGSPTPDHAPKPKGAGLAATYSHPHRAASAGPGRHGAAAGPGFLPSAVGGGGARKNKPASAAPGGRRTRGGGGGPAATIG